MKKIIVSLVGLLFVITTSIVFSGSKMGMYATDPLNPPAGDLDLTSVSTNMLKLPMNNDATNPTLCFDGGSAGVTCDTGIMEESDGNLAIVTNATSRWRIGSTFIYGLVADAGGLRNETASDINPTHLPNRNDLGTGMGHGTTSHASMIGDSIESARFSSSTVHIFGGLKMIEQTNENGFSSVSSTMETGQTILYVEKESNDLIIKWDDGTTSTLASHP